LIIKGEIDNLDQVFTNKILLCALYSYLQAKLDVTSSFDLKIKISILRLRFFKLQSQKQTHHGK